MNDHLWGKCPLYGSNATGWLISQEIHYRPLHGTSLACSANSDHLIQGLHRRLGLPYNLLKITVLLCLIEAQSRLQYCTPGYCIILYTLHALNKSLTELHIWKGFVIMLESTHTGSIQHNTWRKNHGTAHRTAIVSEVFLIYHVWQCI